MPIMCSCPSRTDEPEGSGYNQSPNHLAADLTTNQDMNGIANTREARNHQDSGTISSLSQGLENDASVHNAEPSPKHSEAGEKKSTTDLVNPVVGRLGEGAPVSDPKVAGAVVEVSGYDPSPPHDGSGAVTTRVGRIKHALFTFGQFVGPGFMIAVAYSECS